MSELEETLDYWEADAITLDGKIATQNKQATEYSEKALVELWFALKDALVNLEAMERLLDIERLAHLEHEQWMAWSKTVAHEVSPERQKRWEALWISYDYLTQQEREQDRIWARKILTVAQEETPKE